MRIKLSIIGMIICSWLLSATAFGEVEQMTQAEEVAKKYMTALFHSNFELSFSLMHPDVLKQNKAMLLRAYEVAKQDGKGEEFRRQFQNIDDFDAFLALPAKEFFILLATKEKERASVDNFEATKKATIVVLESARLDDETIQVILEVTTPTLSGKPFIQKVTLLLSPYEDEWRVMK